MNDLNTIKEYSKPRSANNKYIILLIGFLVLVIIGFIVFGGNTNDTKYLEDKIEELKKESQAHLKTADSLLIKVISYKEKSIEFRKRDSLNSIKMAEQEKITHQLRIKQVIAKKEREKVERELEHFKNNPPEYDPDNPAQLLFDTEKRINNDKKNDTTNEINQSINQ